MDAGMHPEAVIDVPKMSGAGARGHNNFEELIGGAPVSGGYHVKEQAKSCKTIPSSLISQHGSVQGKGVNSGTVSVPEFCL